MSLTLTEKQSLEIEAFCNIARENGAMISLRELIRLVSINANESDVEDAFLSDSKLRSKFLLDSGYVLERSPGSKNTAHGAVDEEERRRELARANLRRASTFGRVLLKGTVLVSVSGANSYLSARENEDIDFFCVAKTNGMWPFMLKALVMARLHRLTNRDAPELCFSCIMDEKWATDAFRSRQKPIFARDALTAKVIGGRKAYHALLEEAPWMESYFPAFYNMRLRETDPGGELSHMDEVAGNEGSPVLNSFLYYTLGSFLRMKSWALNRKFTKAARHSSIFALRIGMGFYIYESNRYRKLRGMYGEMEEW